MALPSADFTHTVDQSWDSEMNQTNRRALTGVVTATIVLILTWFVGDSWDTSRPIPSRAESANESTGQVEATAKIDPETGLRWVSLDAIPPEGRETLSRINEGGPFPESRDGVTFENREAVLPDSQRGYYREYTVATPGSNDRGARRIVVGEGGELYYTDDHYQSFRRIAR
jgi:ribonuclease T1